MKSIIQLLIIALTSCFIWSCETKVPVDNGTGTNEKHRKHALSFNGKDNYIIFSDILPALDNNSSWTAWILVDAVPDEQYTIVAKGGRGQLSILKNGKVALLDYLGKRWVSAEDPQIVPFNKWVHYAGTVKSDDTSTVLCLYRDGILIAKTVLPRLLAEHPGCVLSIGGSKVPYKEGPCYFTSPQVLSGFIDEVSVWDKAISAQEVNDIYNFRLTGKENGLMGYWKFEEGEGLISKDETIYGHTADLQHAPQWVKLY